jgi:hypothetical protein
MAAPPFEAAPAPAAFPLALLFPHDAGPALARLPTLPALNCMVAGPAHRRVGCVRMRCVAVFAGVSACLRGGVSPNVRCRRSRHRALAAAPRSGKTTLLFNFAVNTAAAGGHAVFLCRRDRLEASPPLLRPDRAPGDALQRVDMRCACACASSAL